MKTVIRLKIGTMSTVKVRVSIGMIMKMKMKMMMILSRRTMKMRTDKNYYSVAFRYPKDDGTYFSLQTCFDTCGEAVKYALLIASNYLEELDLSIGWCVRYYFRTVDEGWSSMIVVKNTDPVDLRIFKEGGESKQ